MPLSAILSAHAMKCAQSLWTRLKVETTGWVALIFCWYLSYTLRSFVSIHALVIVGCSIDTVVVRDGLWGCLTWSQMPTFWLSSTRYLQTVSGVLPVFPHKHCLSGLLYSVWVTVLTCTCDSDGFGEWLSVLLPELWWILPYNDRVHVLVNTAAPILRGFNCVYAQ